MKILLYVMLCHGKLIITEPVCSSYISLATIIWCKISFRSTLYNGHGAFSVEIYVTHIFDKLSQSCPFVFVTLLRELRPASQSDRLLI